MRLMQISRVWRWFWLPMVLVLSACATNTFKVQQEVFQQWQGVSADQSYAILQSQAHRLDQATYAQMLQSNMWRTGLSRVAAPEQADFLVTFDYLTEPRKTTVRDYDYDPFYYPGFHPYFGWGWGSYWSSWYGGFHYFPRYRSRTREVTYNHYTLQVRIKRRQDQNEVYRATITTDSQSPLPQVMPYMMAAVFDGFPGRNAYVKEIRFDLDAPDTVLE